LPVAYPVQNLAVKSKALSPELLVWLAAVRFIVSILAIPLAPFLYKEHFVVLVLMRPTKEVLLAAGFLVRIGNVSLVPVLLAAVPLMVLGVWLFFYLGRAYSSDIHKGEVPGLGARVIKPDKVKKTQEVLDKKGGRLVLLGRLAAFSSSIVAVAAGAGRMHSRDFLPIDGAGALLSIVLSIGAGYLAGAAYDEIGPWFTGLTIGALVVIAILLGRYLQKD
jgi:membrane protein DedA with SNARE-associated domain